MSIKNKIFAAIAINVICIGVSHSVEPIPRIGVNIGNYYLETYTGNDDGADDMVIGPTAGLLLLLNKDAFLDIGFETYSFTTTETATDVDRTELAVTFGHRIRESFYGILGYQAADYGDGLFDSEYGTSSGLFVGASVNNLRMGEDSTNVFSIALAVQFQDTEFVGIGSDTDESLNLKLGYRKAGAPHSFSLKYQSFGSEFHAEWITMFNYSYQFAKF